GVAVDRHQLAPLRPGRVAVARPLRAPHGEAGHRHRERVGVLLRDDDVAAAGVEHRLDHRRATAAATATAAAFAATFAGLAVEADQLGLVGGELGLDACRRQEA